MNACFVSSSNLLTHTSIAFALSAGLSIEETARFSNLAAGVVVGKVGSATVTLDEIEIYESKLHQSNSDAHIKSFSDIERIVTPG